MRNPRRTSLSTQQQKRVSSWSLSIQPIFACPPLITQPTLLKSLDRRRACRLYRRSCRWNRACRTACFVARGGGGNHTLRRAPLLGTSGAQRIETRLLLIAEHVIELDERGLHSLRRAERRIESLFHRLDAANGCERLVGRTFGLECVGGSSEAIFNSSSAARCGSLGCTACAIRSIGKSIIPGERASQNSAKGLFRSVRFDQHLVCDGLSGKGDGEK